MKITAENIENVLALQFDVDITPEATALILPEVQEFCWKYDVEYHRNKQAQDRYFNSCGIEEDTYIEVGDRRKNAIIMFLIPLIGLPYRLPLNVDWGDDFPIKHIESEYRQKHGNILDVKDLPAKKWKTFDEIPQPPKRSRQRKKRIPAEPSENLLKLNRLLIESKCLETTVDKFQMQLGIIADSGINLDEVEIVTNGNQTFLSTTKDGKTLAVDLLPGRCAIRLYGKTTGIDKIYAHKEKDVIDAIEWLMK